MAKIDYVVAEKKGIVVYLENGKSYYGKTILEIAKLIKKYYKVR